MKLLTIGFLIALLPLSAQDSILTEEDRQDLLERLEEIQQKGDERANSRQAEAFSAFKGAVGDDKAAYALWMKCAEKVLFTDEKRTGQTFREWKRKRGDVLNSKPFRQALRHQLSWLLLAIEAERADGKDMEVFSAKAASRIDAALGDAKILKKKTDGKSGFDSLEGSAFASMFAKAYSVKGPEGWPASPLAIQQIYSGLVLKPYAESRDIENYRKGWLKMVGQLAIYTEMRGEEAETGGKSADFERFLREERPQLQWDLEKTIYGFGDERTASKNMLSHLEKYSGHKSELGWADEFKALLSGTTVIYPAEIEE